VSIRQILSDKDFFAVLIRSLIGHMGLDRHTFAIYLYINKKFIKRTENNLRIQTGKLNLKLKTTAMRTIYQINSNEIGEVLLKRRRIAKSLRWWLRENGHDYTSGFTVRPV
jgi:hypothetical protein